jgi:hypothetical protein
VQAITFAAPIRSIVEDRRQLETLTDKRADATHTLGAALDRDSQREVEARLAQRLREAKAAWEIEHENILAQIRQARHDRARVEFEDLEENRNVGEVKLKRRNWRRFLQVSVFLAIVAVVSLVTWYVSSMNLSVFSSHDIKTDMEKEQLAYYRILVTSSVVVMIASLAAEGAAACFIFFPQAFTFNADWLDIREPVSSLAQVDRNARRFLLRQLPDRPTFWWQPNVTPDSPAPAKAEPGSPPAASDSQAIPGERLGPAGDLLHDFNPYVRYAAALGYGDRGVPAEDSPGHDPDKLLDVLKSESTAVVRRALAAAVGRVCNLSTVEIDSLTREVRETAYLVEAAASRRRNLASIGREMEIVLKLTNAGDRTGLDERDCRRIIEKFIPDYVKAKRLTEAFYLDSMPSDLAFLADLAEPWLRSALTAFSFKDGGLGTFDSLRAIGLIDEFYLLFCQARFYKGRDLLLLPSQSAPTTSNSGDNVGPALPSS